VWGLWCVWVCGGVWCVCVWVEVCGCVCGVGWVCVVWVGCVYVCVCYNIFLYQSKMTYSCYQMTPKFFNHKRKLTYAYHRDTRRRRAARQLSPEITNPNPKQTERRSTRAPSTETTEILDVILAKSRRAKHE
jgi:hypothetical protein